MKSSILRLIGSAVLVVGLAFVIFSVTKHALATQQGTAGVGDECNVHAEDSSHTCSEGLVCIPQNDNSEGNGKCGSSVTPTPTPTDTPEEVDQCNNLSGFQEEVPANMQTNSDHVCSCLDGFHQVSVEEQEDYKGDEIQQQDFTCVADEPTPTPEQTSSNNGGNGGTPDASNPVCNGVQPDAPLLQGFVKTSPTSVFWSWWASRFNGIVQQWIEYGYAKDNLPYNVTIPVEKDGQKVTGWEIGSLDANAPQNWARVCVKTADSCVVCSDPLDP